MKRNIITSLLIIPLLTSCGGGSSELIIKIVDKDYTPILPTIKEKDKGEILQDDTYAYFDFYEVSDFHGATIYNKEEKRLGIERLSTYFDTKREANKGGTFIISGGDMWQGSADSNVTRGNLVTYSMNVMNFASMTLGNHEFDWTNEWIKNNKDRANFPFLAANLIDKTTKQLVDFVDASTVITRGDYKIGIIGTIGDNIRNSIIASAIENYEFANEIDTVKAEATKLRGEEYNCDIVVWSSHNDVNHIKEVAGSTELGVDLIFGGHSHETISTDINGIPALESKDYGRSIPHAQLKINKTTKEVSAVEGYGCDENPTAVDYETDADITGIYKQYSDKYIDPVKEQYLGKANGKFSIQQLANYAVETMFNKIKVQYPDIVCRAAFTNVNGGVRTELDSGDVKYGNIYEAFPFDNELVIMETTGRKLQNYAAGNVSNAAFYQDVYTYGALNASDKYLFITTDYLATNTQYFANAGEVKTYTKLTLRDIIAEAIKKAGTINADDYKTSAKKEFQKIK